MNLTPLLWTARLAAALGLTSLTLTGEISEAYLILGWMAWAASQRLDRYPHWQERLRAWETAAVLVLISIFLLDFFYWGHPIFITVAHFLLLFQLFKLLGLKARKDCLQILIFSFFQLLSACTLSADVWQAIILLLLIPIATAGLFWQQVSYEGDASGQPLPLAIYKPYRRWVVGMCLCAIPVNLVLSVTMFVIFPRLAFRGAFAGLGGGRSGYSEQVNLSQTGVLGLDNSAVLWLQISPAKDRSRWKGYLRGGTLDFFDGQKWNRRGTIVTRVMYADTNGVFKIAPLASRKRLRQTITLVNTSGSTLFGSPYIGEVIAPLAILQLMSDSSMRWTTGLRKPLRYEALSFEQPLNDPTRTHLDLRRLQDYLQLPSISLKQTQELLRKIAPRRSSFEQAREIENYLRTHYQYSLDLGSKSAANPVEDFLFVRRQGPCGHFASAMAVMLRLQGIPARVVAGYYKGTWNSRVEQYLIRERDAHAWVEAYFPEKGWVLFDPSPRASSTPTPQQWFLRVRENWEYLNYQWNRLVIEYDLYFQVKAAKEIQNNTQRVNAWMSMWIDRNLLGFRNPTSEPEAPTQKRKFSSSDLYAAMAVLALLAFLILSNFRQHTTTDPAIAFYQKFLDQMARKGSPKAASETGWEYAQRSGSQDSAHSVYTITRRYYQARFTKRTS